MFDPEVLIVLHCFTSLYSLMSLVRPFSSISPKGLLVSGHLKNVNPIYKRLGTNLTRRKNMDECIEIPYTIQMWWTNCSVSDRSLLLAFAPNRPSYTTYWEKERNHYQQIYCNNYLTLTAFVTHKNKKVVYLDVSRKALSSQTWP